MMNPAHEKPEQIGDEGQTSKIERPAVEKPRYGAPSSRAQIGVVFQGEQ